MQIEVGKYSKLSFTSVTVSHPNEPMLVFDGGGYRTARMVEGLDDGLFTEVNEFVSKLSKQKQQTLYECYCRVEGLFNNYDVDNSDRTAMSISAQSLEDDLIEIVNLMYETVLMDDLLFYIKANRKLKIPSELTNTYATEDKITPAFMDKTYTLSDYIELMAGCLGLRFMIPIWGPLLKIMGAGDQDQMKEYDSFSIIRKSKFYQSAFFERMEVYLSANMDPKDLNMAPALRFLSQEEIPTYAIAITCLRKLSIAPLSCETEKHHLMKIFYGFATNKIKTLGMTMDAGLLDKKESGNFEDDNSSVLCIFKMKEQVSAGDLMVFKVYIEDYVKMATAIDSTIDPAMVELCVQNALQLPANWRATDIQKGLVAWVLSPVITGSIIPLLNKKNKTLLYAMGVAQAVLWHWGYNELAIMVTGAIYNHDAFTFKTQTGKGRLSDTTLAKFDEVYPHKIPLKKQEIGGWSNDPGVRGVELFHHHLALHEWKTQCPKPLAASYEDAHVIGFIEPSQELREKLANLLIKLAEHRLNNDE